jgi:hypothetical protein
VLFGQVMRRPNHAGNGAAESMLAVARLGATADHHGAIGDRSGVAINRLGIAIHRLCVVGDR